MLVDVPATEGTLIDEAQLVAVGEVCADTQVGVVGCSRPCDEHLAAHPEVDDQRGVVGVVGDVEPEVFATTARSGDGLPREPRREIGGFARVAAYRAGVEYLDRGDPLPDNVIGQAQAHGLDLG